MIMARAQASSWHRGFTVIELMIVVALLATIAALAIPNAVGFFADGRARMASSDLLGDLYFARAEALRMQRQVFVQSRSGTADWTSGWIIFCREDGTWGDCGGAIIRQRNAHNDLAVINRTGLAEISFLPTGETAGSTTTSITVAPTTTVTEARWARMRCINISALGRAVVLVDRDSDRTNGCSS